ncbi:MAG TPA: hypothetical protein VJP79_08810 [Nitrososphaera sp.]|nr:hypothetical protein [Nitrososphaera sp.]
MSDEATQYPYSVKVERTSKGARYSIHVYHDNREQALQEATAMYIALRRSLEEQGQAVAPVEKGGKD